MLNNPTAYAPGQLQQAQALIDGRLSAPKPSPFVSVVVPCYKQAAYLPEAVASVVAQTFGNWELIIVNDGSPDRDQPGGQESSDESAPQNPPDRKGKMAVCRTRATPEFGPREGNNPALDATTRSTPRCSRRRSLLEAAPAD